ncbi:homoserine O-succinyltransferase, partial [Vibrio parahaemolyticus V-223/04]
LLGSFKNHHGMGERPCYLDVVCVLGGASRLKVVV